MAERKADLKLHIIAPSAYDDNDGLKQYSRILMPPPAFAILGGIAYQAGRDSNLNITVEYHNERLQRGDGYISAIKKDNSAQNMVVFITAKSFELPRAIDIARDLRRAGKQVVLGGPGITLADTKVYQYLVEEGISFNVGEGENTAPQIIRDVVEGNLKPVYWQKDFVDMNKAPLPLLLSEKELGRFWKKYWRPFAAIDLSEGCPFGCSFCSARKIRGSNKFPSRCRPVGPSVALIVEAHERGQQTFIIDDNLRQAFSYPESKKALIDANEYLRTTSKKGEGLYLFGQADVEKSILKDIPELAAAGYRHLFFGMETKDKLVLANSKKKQNNPALYQAIVDECRRNGIAASTGRMVDFKEQTPASISAETAEFCALVDIINNYLVMPIPGTDDYFDAVRLRQITSWDLNDYDSTHSVRNWFEYMTQEQALAAYRQTFVESFPVKDIIRNGFRPWDVRTTGRLYSRFLAEMGGRIYGRPFHLMMDGLPKMPPLAVWGRVVRPEDGFVGFEHDPNDPEFADPESNKLIKSEFLSKIAWSLEEAAA